MFNEVMQSNVDYLMVEKDFPDSWVELYNPSELDIDLQGYYIGLKSDATSAYQIPESCVLFSQKYVVIYCDKENSGLHTDFRIDSGKGDLYLFDKDKNVIDELHLKKMPAPNVAYGRVTDGAADWQYEVLPSAGYANYGLGAKEPLPDPIFSVSGGVYTNPFALTISKPDRDLPDDTKLYVTIDGSEPTETSSSVDQNYFLEITTSTVVRAKLISKSALPGRSVTHSYIFHPRSTTLPIISIVSNNDYFYSEENGILKGGDNDKTTNCYQGWRRPINAEFFDLRNGQTTIFNQICETMVAGNYSRAYPQKSLKLYAHKRWGVKRFTGSFWDDKPNVAAVKSFTLRNYGTGCLYGRFHDAAVQKIFGTHLSSLDWLAYQPVLLYINGIYKGEYEMRERSDEDYVESNYGGLEDIDICNEHVYWDPLYRSRTLYEQFYDVYTKNQVSYEEITNLMDIDNFIDTFITELFSTNYDYPQNNISVWRRTDEGGIWRWILKDLDYTALFKPAIYNMFHYIIRADDPNSEEYKDANRFQVMEPSLFLYRLMMSFPQFRDSLIDRLTVYLGDFLQPSATLPVLQDMETAITDEVQPTYDAYSDFSKYYGKYENMEPEFDDLLNPYEHFKASFEKMKDFWKRRPSIVYGQMAEFFNLGETVKVVINKGSIFPTVNGVRLQEEIFDGCCFSNRKLKLNTQDDNFGWNVCVFYADDRKEEKNFYKSSLNLDISDFSESGSTIQKVVCTPLNITAIDNLHFYEKEKSIYNAVGLNIKSLSRGINIIQYRDKRAKKIIIK